MPRGRTITAKTRAEIVAAIRDTSDTRSRNQIARDHGLSGAAISAIAKAEGLHFDTSQTELAIAARMLDIKKTQELLGRKFLQRAHDALDAMDSPAETVPHYVSTTEHESGGWKSTILDAPSVADQRNLIVIAGVAAQRAQELLSTTTSADVTEGVSMIGALGAALTGYAQQQQQATTGDVDPTDPTVLP